MAFAANDIISGDYNDVNNNIDFNENVILIRRMLSPMNDRPHHAFTDLSLGLSVDNVGSQGFFLNPTWLAEFTLKIRLFRSLSGW